MKCPFCSYTEDKVVDSRSTSEGSGVRRRRECLECGKRFTTYEYVEEVSLMVIKRDGRRQPFDRQKIIAGIIRACEKRPVSMERMEEIVTQVERQIQKKPDREVPSTRIGELVMERLKALDDVAYVRFASVYRQFKDVGQFMEELKGILVKEKPLIKQTRRKTQKNRKRK
jgi:transcriptional repressor NrdR